MPALYSPLRSSANCAHAPSICRALSSSRLESNASASRARSPGESFNASFSRMPRAVACKRRSAMLIDSGELRPEEAATHPARSRLTRFVGMAGEPLPDVLAVELQTGDKLLLCSDGLAGMVNDTEIFKMQKQRRSPRTICGRLVAAANAAGGKDNVTALVVGISEPPRGSANSRSGAIPRTHSQ